MDYSIISDIGGDIPPELIEPHELYKLNQTVELNGARILIDINNPVSVREFYKQLGENTQVKTNAMTLTEIEHSMKEYIDRDSLVFSFSSSLSATPSQIQMCCNKLDGHPHTVKFYDTGGATLSEGLLIYQAIKNRRKGIPILENIEKLNVIKSKLKMYVILDYGSRFMKGGRTNDDLTSTFVEKTYAVLLLNNGGLYKKVAALLSKNQAINYCIGKIKRTGIYDGTEIFIGSGSNQNESVAVADKIKQDLHLDSYCTMANPVMGAHTGDNALIITYIEP